jgi:hypothetical protein
MSSESILQNLRKIFVSTVKADLDDNGAFGRSWETGDDKFIYISFQNYEKLPYFTFNITQYGDPIIRYAADKQGHVMKIRMFILLNPIF